MRNLLRFFSQFHFIILFLLLELASFSIVVMHHKDGGRFLHSASGIIGFVNKQVDGAVNYYGLKRLNDKLNKENAELANSSVRAFRIDTAFFREYNDTIFKQQYRFMAAKVIKNTVHKPRNFITLDQGLANGIHKDMAVICQQSIVGVVKAVSNDFALVISLLNNDFMLSVKLKNKQHFGSAHWLGNDYKLLRLDGIPSHTKLNKGDTIVTSGYSSIFPENILVGFVDSFRHKSGSNFYEIDINLNTDFTKIQQVMVVENKLRKQQQLLEETTE